MTHMIQPAQNHCQNNETAWGGMGFGERVVKARFFCVYVCCSWDQALLILSLQSASIAVGLAPRLRSDYWRALCWHKLDWKPLPTTLRESFPRLPSPPPPPPPPAAKLNALPMPAGTLGTECVLEYLWRDLHPKGQAIPRKWRCSATLYVSLLHFSGCLGLTVSFDSLKVIYFCADCPPSPGVRVCNLV